MKPFFKILLLVLLLGFISCKREKTKSIDSNKHESNEQWKSLFNGKNLDGWVPKFNGFKLGINYKNTFRVENGVLKVSYENYNNFTDEFGHLFYETPFSNYKLRLEYRFIGKQVNGGESWATKNSGIMLHCQPPKTMLVKQGFPISLEAQLLGGVKKNESRPSGNLCTPGTHVEINGEKIENHCITSIGKTYYGEEWIKAEVVVKNDTIKHYIDNKLVISYSNPTIGGQYLDSTSKEIQKKTGQKLTSGYISLQSESHTIEFKNIEILEF